jgi:hypothetical protein
MRSAAYVLPFVFAFGATQVGAQSARLQGAWQVDQIVLTGPNARTVTDPQPGILIFTNRYYSRAEVTSDAARPDLPDMAAATADELRATLGPYTSNAGTYEVSGGTLTTRQIVAKSPAVMAQGAFTVLAYRIQGDTLWLTAERSELGPVQNPRTVRFRRLE